MSILEIAELSFSYEDGTPAIEGISFKVEQGEKVAIIGPNGAGKSTLFSLIAGFRTPFTGKVIVNRDILDDGSQDRVRRHLGMLFQDPDDQIFMPTVEEDVAFGPQNLDLDDIQGRVTKALRSTGTETLAKRVPHRLSHGMKKRVAIAGVLAMEPAILLLDEPTSGLDPRARSDLIDLLKGMKRTMLMATHDLEAVADLADRVIVINRSIMFDGTLADLAHRKDMLEQAGIELPPLSRLFSKLKDMGYDIRHIPVSVDHATSEATRVIDEAGRKRQRR